MRWASIFPTNSWAFAKKRITFKRHMLLLNSLSIDLSLDNQKQIICKGVVCNLIKLPENKHQGQENQCSCCWHESTWTSKRMSLYRMLLYLSAHKDACKSVTQCAPRAWGEWLAHWRKDVISPCVVIFPKWQMLHSMQNVTVEYFCFEFYPRPACRYNERTERPSILLVLEPLMWVNKHFICLKRCFN